MRKFTRDLNESKTDHKFTWCFHKAKQVYKN